MHCGHSAEALERDEQNRRITENSVNHEHAKDRFLQPNKHLGCIDIMPQTGTSDWIDKTP